MNEKLHENLKHIRNITSDVLRNLPMDRSKALDVTKFAVRETAKTFGGLFRHHDIDPKDARMHSLLGMWKGE